MSDTPMRTHAVLFTFEVGPADPEFDDPEWIADVAHGALGNKYGIRCTYDEIDELPSSTEREGERSD